MGDITYVPRWLHARVTVQENLAIDLLDAGLFANTDLWPMQLHWLSLTGTVVQEPSGDYANAVGGVARRLFFEVGMSQKGDTSANMALADVLFSPAERAMQHHGPYDYGVKFKFPTPVDLPPDSGLVVEMQNHLAPGIDIVWNPGILVNGYKETVTGEREAVQLMGFVKSVDGAPIEQNTTAVIRSADLFNDGRETMKLYEMMLTPAQLHYTRANNVTKRLPQLNQISWRINPTSGPAWMPRPLPIPAGNIAPFNRAMFDMNDEAPRAYVFPEKTMLRPKQRVSIKVGNISATMPQTFDLCLFGMLEVQ